MTARIEIAGKKFGRWLVISYSGDIKWLCKCDCGTEKNEYGQADWKFYSWYRLVTNNRRNNNVNTYT